MSGGSVTLQDDLVAHHKHLVEDGKFAEAYVVEVALYHFARSQRGKDSIVKQYLNGIKDDN